jgi:hypothetical protein
MQFLRNSGNKTRKYSNAQGATIGDAGDSATVHIKTTQESTYNRYGMFPPGPPPITARAQQFHPIYLNTNELNYFITKGAQKMELKLILEQWVHKG